MALPLFAHRCCSNRSISAACQAHSSKPAAVGLLLWHTTPFLRPCSAYYAGSVNKTSTGCRQAYTLHPGKKEPLAQA